MSKYIVAFIVLLLTALPNTGQTAVFNPKTATLPNGMQIVLVENHRAPVVAHMVWYDVGAADEDIGKSGLAHFFEHLMFKGTDKVPPGQFSRIVKRLGGNDNAFTSSDYTAYFQQVPVAELPKVMEMEADRMVNLNTSVENIMTERDVIVEERKERTDNNPSAILREEVMSTLFAGHPYGIPVIGWMDEIKNLNPKVVQEFYKRWYAPNNAILVVTGDITMDQLMPMAEKYYGVLEPTALPTIEYPAPAPIKTDHLISYSDARVGNPLVQINWRAPRGSEALQVWAEAFGGHTTSPLYKKLVVEDKVAVQTGIFYSPVSEAETILTYYGVPAPGTTLEELERAMQTMLKSVLENGLSTDDIDRAKQRLLDAATFERDSLMAPAMVLGRALTSGFTIQDVEEWPDRIQAVDDAKINSATQALFYGEDQPVRSYLLPEAEE